MTIHLSKEAENAVASAVQSGRFRSAGAMVDQLVREYARLAEAHAASVPTGQPAEIDPGSIGAMREDAEFLDRIVADAMKARRERPWGLPAGA